MTDHKAKLKEIADYMDARFHELDDWETDNTPTELIADFFAETLDGIEDILRTVEDIDD